MESKDAKLLQSAAKEAGKIALKYFRNENEVWYKSGNSPVSEADKEVDAFLLECFTRERPNYGWLSEETEDNTERLAQEYVVIVDPIDGTRGFIAGKPEWCISIAIVRNGKPVEAILHCPALAYTFQATAGMGLKLEGLTTTKRDADAPLLATGSKKLIEALLEVPEMPFAVTDFIPSLAYRLALVAAGELDVAFARPGASEWDIAAADLILSEAGCKLTDANGDPVIYNKEKVHAPALVAAAINKHDHILDLAKQSRILH